MSSTALTIVTVLAFFFKEIIRWNSLMSNLAEKWTESSYPQWAEICKYVESMKTY